MQISVLHTSQKLLIGGGIAWLMMVGAVSAQGTWVEELGNAVAYYQLTSPAVEWAPYIDALTRARDALRRGDQIVVSAAMQEFESLLRTHAYGIDQAVAEDLYSLALTIRFPYEPVVIPLASKESERRRAMTFPMLNINVPPQGQIWCHEGGCDEWVSDPNAG